MQQQSKNNSSRTDGSSLVNGNSVDAAHFQGSWRGVHVSLKISAVFYIVLAQRRQEVEGGESTQSTPLFLDARLLSRVWTVCRFEKISLPESRNQSQRETYSGFEYISLCKLQCHLGKVVINQHVFAEDHSAPVSVWGRRQHGGHDPCSQETLTLWETTVKG